MSATAGSIAIRPSHIAIYSKVIIPCICVVAREVGPYGVDGNGRAVGIRPSDNGGVHNSQ